jgi:hypothetical protein
MIKKYRCRFKDCRSRQEVFANVREYANLDFQMRSGGNSRTGIWGDFRILGMRSPLVWMIYKKIKSDMGLEQY